MQIITFPITLKESTMLSSQVKHFVFNAALDPAFNYQPGQFITVHFERGDKSIKRSYSIANIPSQDNTIEFAAGFVEGGPGTDLLFNLKPGDQININGPFGRLILREELPKRYLFVATSTGITPFRAMLDELKRRLLANPSLEVVILQGTRNQEQVLYADEFLAFAAQFPGRVLFRAQLSRVEDETLQPHEFKGYVQNAFAELKLNPENDLVYLCGNPGMIDQSFEYLKEQGFSIQQVIREKYTSR